MISSLTPYKLEKSMAAGFQILLCKVLLLRTYPSLLAPAISSNTFFLSLLSLDSCLTWDNKFLN